MSFKILNLCFQSEVDKFSIGDQRFQSDFKLPTNIFHSLYNSKMSWAMGRWDYRKTAAMSDVYWVYICYWINRPGPEGWIAMAGVTNVIVIFTIKTMPDQSPSWPLCLWQSEDISIRDSYIPFIISEGFDSFIQICNSSFQLFFYLYFIMK